MSADLKTCQEAIRHGSKSFYAASHLLPKQVRNDALALYAFCRMADDAVDLHAHKAAAVTRLWERLDKVYRAAPENNAADRAFAAVVERHDMPRALPDALIEGFAWDAEERTYSSLSDVRAYSARVASAVGAMMAVLMGISERHALARACDLGVAMQLTNIARDVGEDAREGRLYLPLEWLSDVDIDPDAFLANPLPSEELATVIARLLGEADRLYKRSEAGIAALPTRCRPAIYAARLIYAEIGAAVADNGFDAVSYRAHTSTGRKLALVGGALAKAAGDTFLPNRSALRAPVLSEVAFLVDAAARKEVKGFADRIEGILNGLAKTAEAERTRRQSAVRAVRQGQFTPAE